jgi:hypothetical protein
MLDPVGTRQPANPLGEVVWPKHSTASSVTPPSVDSPDGRFVVEIYTSYPTQCGHQYRLLFH